MPLPWKKPKSGRISRFVSDLQQSPKHGGSLVVETGFPTSLIDLFVKNRDRLKKSKKVQTLTASDHSPPPPPLRRIVSSPSPSPPPLILQRRGLLLDPVSVTEESKINESFVNRHDSENNDGDTTGNHGGASGGGGCVLMVVVFKVFLVAVLALSTKKLAVGITLSAFTLLFLELAVARVFTLFNLCPNAQFRLDSLIGKLIGKRREDEESSSNHEIGKNKVSFEIIEESLSSIEENRVLESNCEDTLEKTESKTEEKEVQTIRDVLFKNEKSKSARIKSKMKKIVPKKLRSYKKKKKMKEKEQQQEEEDEEEETESVVSEVSSLFSESEISERDDISSNPPLMLETCEEEETEEVIRSKGDLMKVMVLIVIVLIGLLIGKVFAMFLTLSWCLILRVFCYKSLKS